LTCTNIEQVRTGTHGAEQVWRVVEVVACYRGTTPATLEVRSLVLATWLLRVTVHTAHINVLLTAAQLYLGVRLEPWRGLHFLDLQVRDNDQSRCGQGQRHHGAA